MLSGDAFFVDSVGRPDLLGDDQTEELTEKLFHTVRDVFMALPDDVIVYPCHGAGSSCGPDIGDRMSSTIGYERRFNGYARIEDLEEFKQAIQGDAPPVPTHYPRMKEVNAKGPEVLRNLPRIQLLIVEQFAHVAEDGAQILDTRDRSAPYASYCASGFRASIASSLLAANGFTDIHNVPGSWKAWTAAGYPIETPYTK